MKLYFSNKFNLNSNSKFDNLYKNNKNYDRPKKKKKKETQVDNHEFDFWVEISTNYFFILYMANKASLFFWRKI